MRNLVRLGGWSLGLTAALGALVAAGGRLPAPPVDDPGATWAWIVGTDPMLAAFALVRVAAIVVVGYLLVSTLLVAAAHTTRAPILGRAASRIVLPSVRRVVHQVVGTGLAISVLGSASVLAVGASAGPVAASSWTAASATGDRTVGTEPPSADVEQDDPTPEPPVLQALPDLPVLVDLGAAPPATGPVPTTDPIGPPPPQPSTTEPPGSTPTDSAETTTAPRGPAAPPVLRSDPADAARSNTPGDDAPPAATYTIVAGDHLWGVADRTLAFAWGRPPGPAATAVYLELLVDRNRSVLAVADDPDLVFPGQVFALPELPAPPISEDSSG